VTLSLVGCCARTGMLGAIVMSSSPAVAARCAWARSRVGAACTQNITDPSLGAAMLDRIAAGATAADALAAVTAATAVADYRQLTAVDAFGRAAAFSGAHTLGRHADVTGADCAAAGNLLADEAAPAAMAAAFAADPAAHLGDRLMAALVAGRDAGGEALGRDAGGGRRLLAGDRPARRLHRGRPGGRARRPVGHVAAPRRRLRHPRARSRRRTQLRGARR
jgi:uncharacterized Ntn-hydrolase superfamily protein